MGNPHIFKLWEYETLVELKEFSIIGRSHTKFFFLKLLLRVCLKLPLENCLFDKYFYKMVCQKSTFEKAQFMFD